MLLRVKSSIFFKIMTEQKFTLDLTNILGELTAEEFSSIDPVLQSFLVERYNPILAKIADLYQDNPNIDQQDPRLQTIAVQIETFLKSLPNGKKLIQQASNLENDFSNSYTASTDSHLAFLLQGINNAKKLHEIIHGYYHEGEHRIGLNERFEGAFFADFNRSHPKIIDQNNTILDEDFFSSTRKYVALRTILAKLNKLHQENPNLDKQDKRLQALSEEIADLEEELNNKPTLLPIIQKKSLSKHLNFITNSIENGESLNDIMHGSEDQAGLLRRFVENQECFTKASLKQVLQSKLNLSDEQLKFLISRYNQRSITGVENALYTSLDAGKSGLRNELFHVQTDKDHKISLEKIEYQCISQKYLRDENGEIIEDGETGKKEPLHRMSYIADVRFLHQQDALNYKSLTLPIQNAYESLTCEALSLNGASYQLPEILKHRTKNNLMLANSSVENTSLTNAQIIKMLHEPRIEHELLPENLRKLVTLANLHTKKKIPESIIRIIIKNEITQVKKEQPKLYNGIFSNDLTNQIQKNLANIFSNPHMLHDQTLTKELNQYLTDESPNSLDKIHNYINIAQVYKVNVTSITKTKLSKNYKPNPIIEERIITQARKMQQLLLRSP